MEGKEPVVTPDLVAAGVREFVRSMSGGADGPTVDAATALVETVRLPAGEALVQLGEPSDAVYFVVTGRLVVEDPKGGPPRQRLGRGDLVGEMGILADAPRNATVRADRDCLLAKLSRESFERLATDHPGFGLGVARAVAARLSPVKPPDQTVHTVAFAVAHPGVPARTFSSRLLTTMEGLGTTSHLTAAKMDLLLGSDGASEAVPGSPGWTDLADMLDVVETANEWVLLEAGDRPAPWATAALRHADRALVVMSSDPDEAEARSVTAFMEAAGPAGRRGKWLVVVWPADTDIPHGTPALLERFGATRALHVREGSDRDLARVARLATGTGTGLVLGGGGARGYASLGVFRAMEELGIPVDAIAGASIGGALSGAIALGHEPDELDRLVTESFHNVLDYTIPIVSLVGGRRIAREIGKHFGDSDITDLPVPFLCTSTNLTTSELVVHDRGSATKAIRAGLAIPGVIPPVPHDGDLLVDGGVRDNLPIGPLRHTGLVNTLIAVDVAPPVGPKARHDYGLSVTGTQALRGKMRKLRYPGISALLLRSMLVGSMAERDRLVAEGYADLYLDLDLRGISLLAFNEVDSVARAGYEAAKPRLEAFLAEQVTT
ncbi:MAG: cyclic nucleotide-binding domain-containing protein [Acidimicrobiia bacterium]|nr:cyclic nucleotide-binding domain-containing protein [Acidimicrobiia bacterium]